VVVEAGKEAEAVLAGERAAPAGGGPRDRDAARLAAERLALVDVDAEASFGQLVRRGQAGHAAAEDRDLAPAAAPPRPPRRPRRRRRQRPLPPRSGKMAAGRRGASHFIATPLQLTIVR
jgi:hypothetical protein